MALAAELRKSISLLKEAQAGDQRAFDELMGRYFDRVHRIVRARMGANLRRRNDSMDVAQNAMLRVIKGLNKFEPRSEGALINWMSKLVENELRDMADYDAAQKRRVSKDVPILPRTASQPGTEQFLANPNQKTPSEEVTLKEDVMALEAALDKLGSNKEVIILRDYSGLTFKEIGKELEMSEDAARMRYIRSLNKLTDIMASESDR